jgi:uncharacterized repeat protein (TIGR03943 family)
MNRPAQAVVMLLLGGAVVKASVSGMFLRYVKHGLRPVLIAAGVLLILTAVMTLWYDLRARTAGHDDGHDAGHDGGPDDGHGHAHREPRVGWLLLLPALGLLLIAPPALGSFAAGKTGSVLTVQNAASDYPALPAGDPVPLPLLDYASRAVFDQGRSLTGRTLRLTGFVTPGPDGQPALARIIVSCCAADGRPIKIALSGNAPHGVAANTWLTVVGTYTPKTSKDPINGAPVPYLNVSTWQEVPVPEQQYE